MNYKVKYYNYIENGIDETYESVDNQNVFKTFLKAKKKLIQILTSEKTEINYRISEVKKLK